MAEQHHRGGDTKQIPQKLDTDEFLARLRKIVKRLQEQEHEINVDIEIQLGNEPCLVFKQTAYETCILFEVIIKISRFIEMDDKKFDKIFEMEFGKEIKEYSPWTGI